MVTGKVDVALGKVLSAAKEDQEDSDYEVYAEISREEVEKVLNEAEVFLEKVRDIAGRE